MESQKTVPMPGRRGKRWDAPLGDEMTEALVDQVLGIAPFSAIDPTAFPRATPLRDIIKNDTRIVPYKQGELVVREGDYGNTAYLVLEGSLVAALDKLDPKITGRPAQGVRSTWRSFVAQLLGAPSKPPVTHDRSAHQGVFLQDFPRVLSSVRTAEIGAGEVFGELSALNRSPRTATVFAARDSTLLEIRWQGLRDLMKHAPELKNHLDALYRKNSLLAHLRETPMLRSLGEESLQRVAQAISFVSYGNYDWRDRPHSGESVDPYERALLEPVVVEEAQPVEALLFVRSGFARAWRAHGEGRLTLSYVGKGSVLGAEELAVSALYGDTPEWKRSISAVGYLDVLRLPAEVFADEVLPHLPKETVREWASTDAAGDRGSAPGAERARRFDFLVDNRFVNGAEAMVIDLDRCTRCDDCVRACAETHDGVARFTRQGPVHDGVQFTQACMHCADPVCMIGCPTGAIHRDEATGVVRVNDATCIGCSTCANSCPYDNIQMIELRDTKGAVLLDEESKQPLLLASKCDLCYERGVGPVCQHSCPHDALVRLDLTNPAPLAEWANR